ncbi:MAG: hypothetical protein GY903_28690 [Fuerstiella sp.]|nr:hypothetical protein [Fuerstiella sp.]
MIRFLTTTATLFCTLTAAFCWSETPSTAGLTGPDDEVITTVGAEKSIVQRINRAQSPATPVQTTQARLADSPLNSNPGKPLPPDDIEESPVVDDVPPMRKPARSEASTQNDDWKGPGATFSMPVGFRQQHAQLKHAQLTLKKLKTTHGDLHPSVKEQESVIQSLESTLGARMEVFDILSFTRSELVERKDAVKAEHGQLHPEVARLDALLALLDKRIEAIEEAVPEKSSATSMSNLSKDAENEIKVFALKNCDARAAADLLRELIADKSFRPGVDERTNSLVVTGTAEQLKTVEVLLLKLDKASAKELPGPGVQLDQITRLLEKGYHTDAHVRRAEADTADVRKRTGQLPDDGNAVIDTQADGLEDELRRADIGIPANELQQQVAQLRKDYESADQQAHQLANSLRKSPDSAIKAKLRSTVQQAFSLRQSLLRAELMEMQARLLQTQRSINTRERIADQIVDSRVEDLLNPQLEWESSSIPNQQSLTTNDSSRASFPGLNQMATDATGVFAPVAERFSGLHQPHALGIVYSDDSAVPEDLPQQFRSGLRIGGVDVGLAAEKGGLKKGDILVGLGNWQTACADDLKAVLRKGLPGAVPYYIVRDGSVRRGHVRPDGSEPPAAEASQPFNQPPPLISPADVDLALVYPMVTLDSLQGSWEVKQIQPIMHAQWNIRIQGQAIASEGSTELSPLLKGELELGDKGAPQPVDFVDFIVNGGHDSGELNDVKIPRLQGIVQQDSGIIRIAFEANHPERRPGGFDASSLLTVWELRRPGTSTASATSELEGEWHRVPFQGTSIAAGGRDSTIRPYNRTFRGDRSIVEWSGGGHECRIQLNPEAKTIWYFSDEEDGSFFEDHYELKGDQLFLRDAPEHEPKVFERGHVRIPNVVPTVTSQQQTLWRSAVVEIIVSGIHDEESGDPGPIGFGVVVQADGTLVSHLSGDWSSTIRDWPNINAQFDDGSKIPLQVVEVSSDIVILRPKNKVNLNHHFSLSIRPPEIGDEVNIGQMAVPTLDNGDVYSLVATNATLSQTDRHVAGRGSTVWQLASTGRIPNSRCLPVLSGNGRLLAITMVDTGGLLLAISAGQLREMFPGIFDANPSTDIAPTESP